MGRNWSTKQLADAYLRQGRPCPILDACNERPRHKYGVNQDESARTVDGIVFDSAREAFHYRALKIAFDMGKIADLELQPKFVLQRGLRLPSGAWQRAITYKADFKFTRINPDHLPDKHVVVDVKSEPTKTQAFRIKWKMAQAQHPELQWEIWH